MYRKIIDVHHHAFPPEAPVRPWTMDHDRIIMERSGVTDALLSCPLQTETSSAHRYNGFLAAQVSLEPAHHKMLGSLPYDDVGATLEEISFVLDDCGAAGFALNTHNNGIYLGDDYLNPVFDVLNSREAIVALHPCHYRAPGNDRLVFTGNDSVYEYAFDTTRAIMDFVFQGKVGRWPNIRWILPHAGGAIPFLAHRMAVSGQWGCIQQSEDEVMRVLRSFYYDLALNHAEVNYAFLRDFAGADHLLLGTDYPNSGEGLLMRDLALLRKTNVFTEMEKQQIFYGTAERIFGA